ncbi:MAG: translation initiation factor IF-2 N-terminal domain-containing protein, partial [Acidimicrobiales bacterium]
MAKKIRVYELARELGLTNKEALDLCESLGIGVRSHSSSIEDAQADRARRKADRDGLRRDVSPEEPTRTTSAPEPVEVPVRTAPWPPAPPVPPPAGPVTPVTPVPPSGRDPRLIVSRPTPPVDLTADLRPPPPPPPRPFVPAPAPPRIPPPPPVPVPAATA